MSYASFIIGGLSTGGINPTWDSGHTSTSKVNGNAVVAYEALSSFKDVANSEKQNLFIKKLNLGCVVFDFIDPTKNVKEKHIKKQTLVELVDYITSANGKFTETVMQEIVRMVSISLFRALSTQSW
ncbi:unnamed protein product [Fraxinus pennsylvanica]|uniref:Uncharacterized protein n=1 Tax=Fraxinus pennsylvanica TaxID=56036 RepID=A0AAD1Z772_9LAMI|nr:unnamed protein product [Fraxinus pennsylvanica]